MITLSSCKYYEKSQTVELLYSTEYNQGPLIGHNKAINDREDSYWSPIKRLKAVYETCFVPEGTKLAARFARCLFVKTSRFNEKQYHMSAFI